MNEARLGLGLDDEPEVVALATVTDDELDEARALIVDMGFVGANARLIAILMRSYRELMRDEEMCPRS